MTIIPPLQCSQMYFRSHLVSIKCFPPFQSYTEVLEGPGNHSRGAILSNFHLILARNKSWTILNDHYTTSTVLLDVFQITFGVYEVFPTLPKLYRGLGRAGKSFARSNFELFAPYFSQKQDLDHAKRPLYHLYSTSRCILDHFCYL